jgi:hypothetical protein
MEEKKYVHIYWHMLKRTRKKCQKLTVITLLKNGGHGERVFTESHSMLFRFFNPYKYITYAKYLLQLLLLYLEWG